MVSNHCSYLDVPLLLNFCSGRFIAKHEVKSWPVIGWLTKWYGTLFINRERIRSLFELNQFIEQLFESNQVERVWLFPEGTTSNGEEVLPYMPSLLRTVEKRHPEIPVHQAVIKYATDRDQPPARDFVCWWGEGQSFGSHAWRMLQIPRIYAQVYIYQRPFLTDDRKKLANELEAAAADWVEKKKEQARKPAPME
jgi:1-acyl-sn-glycerol-3-phosphate acyltransferase